MLELREYEMGHIRSVSLTRADRRLIRLLDQAETSRLKVVETREGVEVKASFWVGVAQFEQFEVRVRPKLVGGEDILMSMLDYAWNTDAFRRYAARRSFEPDTDGLLEIFIRLLVEDCERLVRLGLLTDYVEREEAMPAVRGRILFERQVLERFGRVDRVLCRYDEREHDVVENRLLGFALGRCARLTRNLETRRRVRRLLQTFEVLCRSGAFDLAEARRSLVYTRLNEHYRPAHGLAWAIIDALGIDDFYDSVSRGHHAFLLNMNTLFERFVERLVADALEGLPGKVRKQFTDGGIIRQGETGSTYRNIRPDVLVEFPRQKLPIDAKYKLYDDKAISTADVYQLYFYSRVYREGPPRGMLIFPSTEPRSDVIDLRDSGGASMGKLTAYGVDVAAVLGPREDELNRLRNSLLMLAG